MSRYPCLTKSFIQQFLDDGNERYLEKDCKGHLNSNVLNKYLEIKRQQDQKFSQILPKYQIFPKKYSQYNIYTSNYDLDRLQRMRNGQNQKYYQKSQICSKNSKSQKHADEYFKKSNSHLVVSLKNKQNTEKDIESKQTLGFYDSKSARSLDQTNISPSKISKNINTKASSRIYVQSDSEASLGKIHSNKMMSKVKFSEIGSVKNDMQKMYDYRRFGNAQSLLSINAKVININQNDDYYQENSYQNTSSNNSSRKIQINFANQSQKFEKEINAQKIKVDKKTNLNTKNIRSPLKQKANDKIRFKQSYRDDQEKEFYKNHSSFQVQNPSKFAQINQKKKQSYSHNQNKQGTQHKIITSSNLDQKLLEYYGQEFQRIKEQRDYLRKHFIEHLQKKHTLQLPYSKLTSIDVDQNGQKLIVHTQKIPAKNHKKVIQTIEITKIDQYK